MKLSCTSVMLPRWTLDETFDKLAAYGYDGVELRCRYNPEDAAEPAFWGRHCSDISPDNVVEKAAQIRAAAARSNQAQPPTPLSVYIHIPFSKSLCYYCACNKIITHKTERAVEYLEYLKREIAMQGALFDRSRKLTQLHLGGGTPTYFTS